MLLLFNCKIGVGLFRSELSPKPSSPFKFCPQIHTYPLLSNAIQWVSETQKLITGCSIQLSLTFYIYPSFVLISYKVPLEDNARQFLAELLISLISFSIGIEVLLLLI